MNRRRCGVEALRIEERCERRRCGLRHSELRRCELEALRIEVLWAGSAEN